MSGTWGADERVGGGTAATGTEYAPGAAEFDAIDDAGGGSGLPVVGTSSARVFPDLHGVGRDAADIGRAGIYA